MNKILNTIMALTLALASLSLTSCDKPSNTTPEDTKPKKEYGPLNESDVTLAFMGDSITELWKRGKDADELFWELHPDFLNKGISGQTTSQMIARFETDITSYKPKAVIICAGTNDIARNQGYISNPDIMKNLATMCEMAEAAGSRVILCSLLPADHYFWNNAIKPVNLIKDLNNKIRDYCEETGYEYIDYYTPFVNSNGGLDAEYSSDGVHPTKKLYQKMEKLVIAALSNVLE